VKYQLSKFLVQSLVSRFSDCEASALTSAQQPIKTKRIYRSLHNFSRYQYNIGFETILSFVNFNFLHPTSRHLNVVVRSLPLYPRGGPKWRDNYPEGPTIRSTPIVWNFKYRLDTFRWQNE